MNKHSTDHWLQEDWSIDKDETRGDIQNILITSIINVKNWKFNQDKCNQLVTTLLHSITQLTNLFYLPLLNHSFICTSQISLHIHTFIFDTSTHVITL